MFIEINNYHYGKIFESKNQTSVQYIRVRITLQNVGSGNLFFPTADLIKPFTTRREKNFQALS